MNAARDLLERALQYGVVVEARGDRLSLRAPKAPPAEVVEELRVRKAEVLTLLAGDWGDDQEERAAIVEHDAGAPREWAEGFARLDPARPPGDVPRERWLAFLDDCGRFLDGGWGPRAAALGWGPLDLFGCDRVKPFARIDRQGLLWILGGHRLVALTAELAKFETETGKRLTYRPAPLREAGDVLPWELNVR